MSTQTFDPAVLAGITMDLAAEGDYYAQAPIPQEDPQGLVLTFTLGMKGVQFSPAKTKSDGTVSPAFIYSTFTATVAEGPQEGARFFGMMNTRPRKLADGREGPSEISHFLRRCGYGEYLNRGLPAQDLIDLVAKVFEEGHTLVGVKIKWHAEYVPPKLDAMGQPVMKKGNDGKEYPESDWSNKKIVARRMSQFPLVDPSDPSKGYVPEIPYMISPGQVVQIPAEVRIADIPPQG